MGPEFSSDVSGDGPRREDRDSKSTEESPSSDTKSGSSDHRPPTPPKPRGMTKRNYKNYVRKHRNKTLEENRTMMLSVVKMIKFSC